MTEKLAWAEIEPRLQQLRVRAIALLEEFPDEADFSPRFADLADEVKDAANDACFDDVCIRITDIQIDLKIVPEHERQN